MLKASLFGLILGLPSKHLLANFKLWSCELKTFRFQMQRLNPLNHSPQTQPYSYSHEHSYIPFLIQKLNWFEWFYWFEYFNRVELVGGWMTRFLLGEEERGTLKNCLKKDGWPKNPLHCVSKAYFSIDFFSANSKLIADHRTF